MPREELNYAEERYYHELLLQAIRDAECPYCHASPGDVCVTVHGRAPGTAWAGLCHSARLHAGHDLLREVGDPMFPRSERACRRPRPRYRYLGDKFTDPTLRGALCDPVRREDGKCITGRNGSQLVRFVGGREAVVLRRRLRLLEKQP